jgi:hypothetical protein
VFVPLEFEVQARLVLETLETDVDPLGDPEAEGAG